MSQASSIRHLGRVTGLLYLPLLAFGMYAPIVFETLVVPGDAAVTAGNIVDSLWLFRVSLVSWVLIVVTDVAMSVVLYLLLEEISRVWSLISAAFRLVYSTVLAAFLLSLFRGFLVLTGPETGAGLVAPDAAARALADFETFGLGFVLALILFGVHLVFFGALLRRSGYVPAALAVLLVVAGAGYILDSLATLFLPDHSALASTILLTPALLGEVGLTGWLLVKGVHVAVEGELPPLTHGAGGV